MTGENKGVARVGLHCRVDIRFDPAFDRAPGLPEAAVHLTAGAERAGVCQREVDVGEPVVEIAAAAEGEDNQFVGPVRGDETGNIAVA